MIHQWMLVWFGWVKDWGYAGVFALMAMESSIIPVPSEIVMPPAAFWAAQVATGSGPQMTFWGVVLAGTLGSYVGSALSYWGAYWLGTPVLKRYGKYFLLPPDKLDMAENWVKEFGVAGIFIARLLPVVRHLISMPAGVLRMNFLQFSVVTTLRAALWCTILAWFGQRVLGSQPELLESPEAMVAVMKGQLRWFVVGVLLLAGAYATVIWIKRNRLNKGRLTQP